VEVSDKLLFFARFAAATATACRQRKHIKVRLVDDNHSVFDLLHDEKRIVFVSRSA
jgi:hypothetical protein